MTTRQRPLLASVTAALLWLAAFSYASGVFFALTMLTTWLPPTPPLAVGIVTILHYSKLRDYVNASLFFVTVPLLTLWFRRLFPRWGGGAPSIFYAPFLLAPFFYLTTGKAGWVLLLPPLIAFAAVRALDVTTSSRWLRDFFARELWPYHALLFAESIGWIVFRYIVTGRRIAHIATLFLEVPFLVLFFAVFWAVALLISRLAELHFGVERTLGFRRITTAAMPFVALPFAGFIEVPTPSAPYVTMVAILLVALLALRVRPLQPRSAWRVAAYVLFPILVFTISYASSAHVTQWVDLFHRGESLGPASDYLRGKTPYVNVFPLHGMLEDGLLDAWLMELFGRDFAVTAARTAVIGSLLGVSLWLLGLAIFDSIPLALLTVVMGAWTTAENDRTFFQVAAVALLWIALRRKNNLAAVASGVFAALALFFSYDIGLYTIAGAFAALCVIGIVRFRAEWTGLGPLRAAAMFVIGLAAGSAPFVVYLALRHALGPFVTTSFVTIPKYIDPVWSLPFPDLVTTFRGNNLNLHTLSDFVLQEKFHIILSPLVIAIATIYAIQRLIRRRVELLDVALIVLTVFAAITQRTAFGRAEFRHQYFAAFLIGPIIVLLVIFALRRVREIWRAGDEGTRAFLTLLLLCFAPIASVLFWIPDLINARLDDVINFQRRVLRVQYDPHADEVQDRIGAVSERIDWLVKKKSDAIYDFSNQPAFYFFANRPNPTRFYQVPIASPRDFQAEVISDLERAKPRVVIRTSPEWFDEFDGVPNTMRAQAIAAYLDDCYAFYNNVRGVELWTRRPAAKAQRLEAYLRRVHMPSEKELATSFRERMVFPLAGAADGANGAFWVSDLTLHNPRRESIAITLRLAMADQRIDREVQLAPRQTLELPAIVETLFHTRGLGSLWIDYRGGHAPVAILKTADVNHGGRASIEKPLTISDAATKNGEQAELTIVGVPGGADRRVSIGVVNTGNSPAIFRISATNRKTFDVYVSEDEVSLVQEPEKKLGVPITDATTIRLTPIMGSGVAFATVVDPTGDTQFIPAVPSQK